MINIKQNAQRFKKNKKAVSPAISMSIITAVTILLVLVASNYAYSALERQQGVAEFQSVQKSFLTYDDAVRDVAWNKGSYRTARFDCNYGFLEVAPDAEISISIAECPNASYVGTTGYLRYNLSTNYLTFGNGYTNYIFGNESSLVSSSREDLGQLVIRQDPEWINTCLSYRMKVMQEPSTASYTYVDILITKLGAEVASTYSGEIDLTAKNMGISTVSYGPYPPGYYTLNANLSGVPNTLHSQLRLNIINEVVFNFVISDVQVTV